MEVIPDQRIKGYISKVPINELSSTGGDGCYFPPKIAGDIARKLGERWHRRSREEAGTRRGGGQEWSDGRWYRAGCKTCFACGEDCGWALFRVAY